MYINIYIQWATCLSHCRIVLLSDAFAILTPAIICGLSPFISLMSYLYSTMLQTSAGGVAAIEERDTQEMRKTHTVGMAFSGGVSTLCGARTNKKKSAVLTQRPTICSIEMLGSLL